MPTVFDQPDDGDVTHVAQINQYAPPVNALESGAAYWAGSSGGTTTAYTASLTPAANDNTPGTIVNLIVNANNTGASTLAVNGHAALPIRKNGVAVSAGDLIANAGYSFITDGTYWHVIGGGGSASSTNASSAFSTGQVPLARGGTGADLSATGGTNQFLKQSTAGGAITVGLISAGDLPFHSASIITSGTLALARGGTGADLSATGGTGQVLKQNSAGGAVTVGTLTNTDVGAAAASHTHAISDLISGILSVARGGTGLSALGSALQILRTNAAATAMEWATLTATITAQYCIVGKTTSDTQGLTSGADNAINFGANYAGQSGWHSTSSNISRVIPTVSGSFLVLAFATIDESSSTNVRSCIRKNGTTKGLATNNYTGAGSGVPQNIVGGWLFDLNGSTDYVEDIRTPSAAGSSAIGSANDNSFMIVVKIGD